MTPRAEGGKGVGMTKNGIPDRQKCPSLEIWEKLDEIGEATLTEGKIGDGGPEGRCCSLDMKRGPNRSRTKDK